MSLSDDDKEFVRTELGGEILRLETNPNRPLEWEI